MNHEQSGFSLIEILVALFLVTIVITTFTVSDSAFSNRSRLDQALDNLERAARFSKDEAVLRNAIVRILINLDEDPQTFTVQFTTNKDFLLTEEMLSIGEEGLGLSEQEEEEKEINDLNKQFSDVEEFTEEPFELPINIKILAVGNALTKNFQLGGQASLFVYPTGERDSSVIYLMSDDEMAYVELPKFTNQFERSYRQLDNPQTLEEDEEEYIKMAQDHFGRWLKD